MRAEPPAPENKLTALARKVVTSAVTKALTTYASLVIGPARTEDDCRQMEQALLWCRERQKDIGEVFDPIVRDNKKAYDTACTQRRTVLSPFVQLETSLRARIKEWSTAKEKRRIQQEQDLHAENRRKLAPPPPPTVESNRGIQFIDREVLQQEDDIPPKPAPPAIVTPTPTVQVEQPSIPMQKVWFATITDPLAVHAAIGKGDIPADICTFHEAKLNEYASRLEAQMATWPGIAVDFEMRPIARQR